MTPDVTIRVQPVTTTGRADVVISGPAYQVELLEAMATRLLREALLQRTATSEVTR